MLKMALAAVLLLPLLLVLRGRWRLALLFAILVGFLQDPMRKMAPGEPVHFVLLVLVVVGIAAIVPFLRGGGIRLRWLFHRDKLLTGLASVLLVLVVMQAVHSLARWQNPVLPAIGLMFYFAPFFALWLGSRYATTLDNVETLLRVYTAMALVMAATVLLSFSGMEPRLFEEVGGGITIHTFQGPLETHVGLFRATEIAAWHLVTAACFVTILGVASGKIRWIVLAMLIALGLVALTMLTGRRKVLALFAGFAAVFAFLLWNMRGRSVRSNLVAGTLSTAFVVFVFLVFAAEQRLGETWASYLTRASTVWGDMDDRMTELGFGSILWAWNRGGIVGLGTGAAAQGAQHFGGGVAGGAGEGGLGKITVELGAAGLVVFGLFFAALARHFWRIMKLVRRQPQRMQVVFYGLLAWLGTNVPVFVVASQAYGDPFILLLLGLSAGMLLAGPEMVQRMALRQQWAAARPVSPLLPTAAEIRR